MKKFIKELVSWGLYLLVAIIIVMVINSFIIQPTQVQGESMESTLHNNDRLIINKLPHTFKKDFDYGDIVIIDSRVNRPRTFLDELTFNFRNNLITLILTGKQDDFYFIKRIVGKGGDTISFEGGQLIRNGVPIDEPYIDKQANYRFDQEITIEEGFYFVLGDNRENSKDSRHIGCIPEDHIIGKYWIKLN
ncbi:MAG: signal peptidase I [bacterium]